MNQQTSDNLNSLNSVIDDNLLSKWKIGKELVNDLKSCKTPIVTRFPPEPSGYLHIGHIKALMINYVVAQYNTKTGCPGQMLIRFDDTNPSNESILFENEMRKDISEILNCTFTFQENGSKQFYKISYTSDYFPDILAAADFLVANGLAYVDDTPPEELKAQRLQRIENEFRFSTIETNQQKWDLMKKGELQQSVLRIKLDMKHNNGCMRDPTIYRYISDHHERAGDCKVYPTYDFACPIVDDLEKVTHVFRSTEFTDRDPQYKAILSLLKLKCPNLYGYGKLTFQGAVLSKRKIRKLIEDKVISDWDSPQLLTWQGAKRRGLTREGLFGLLAQVGITRTNVEMTQDSLWAINQKVIDKIATRYQVVGDGLATQNVGNTCTSLLTQTCLSAVCIVNIVNFHEQCNETTKSIPRFVHNSKLGNRLLQLSHEILLSVDDYYNLVDGEEITLINWGNAIVEETNFATNLRLHLEGDHKTTKKKLCWVTNGKGPIVYIVQYPLQLGHPIKTSRFYGEITMVNTINPGDYVQLMRMGYYICDSVVMNEKGVSSIILIELPSASGSQSDKK